MTDYEEISIIVGQVRGLIARADKITENGRNLSDQKIEIGITGGTYTDFCEIVKKVREINDRNRFRQHSMLLSLANFGIGNWSELVGKCETFLPIVEAFQRKLRPFSPRVGGYNSWSG
ncbi:hypothetical protein ES703_106964 [subsurface metagenome]